MDQTKLASFLLGSLLLGGCASVPQTSSTPLTIGQVVDQVSQALAASQTQDPSGINPSSVEVTLTQGAERVTVTLHYGESASEGLRSTPIEWQTLEPGNLEWAAPELADTAPQGSTGEEPDDVDTEFERLFSSGSLRLALPENVQPQMRALSARPFSADAGLDFEEGEAGFDALDVGDDAWSGVEIHVFSIGQADSMLVIGPAPERRTLLVDVGETGWNSRRGTVNLSVNVRE